MCEPTSNLLNWGPEVILERTPTSNKKCVACDTVGLEPGSMISDTTDSNAIPKGHKRKTNIFRKIPQESPRPWIGKVVGCDFGWKRTSGEGQQDPTKKTQFNGKGRIHPSLHPCHDKVAFQARIMISHHNYNYAGFDARFGEETREILTSSPIDFRISHGLTGLQPSISICHKSPLHRSPESLAAALDAGRVGVPTNHLTRRQTSTPEGGGLKASTTDFGGSSCVFVVFFFSKLFFFRIPSFPKEWKKSSFWNIAILFACEFCEVSEGVPHMEVPHLRAEPN